jgi:hypothetical protein
MLMALSRAYLAAHWLSDAAAGILLGTSCALLTALVTGQFQRRQSRLQRPAPIRHTHQQTVQVTARKYSGLYQPPAPAKEKSDGDDHHP